MGKKVEKEKEERNEEVRDRKKREAKIGGAPSAPTAQKKQTTLLSVSQSHNAPREFWAATGRAHLAKIKWNSLDDRPVF